jgi:hypothetical protein
LKLSDDREFSIKGMTTNERLLHFGLLNQFNQAARLRNRAGMIDLLSRALVDDPEDVTDTILAAPQVFGF